jgi:hypothetical protein
MIHFHALTWQWKLTFKQEIALAELFSKGTSYKIGNGSTDPFLNLD